PVQRARRHGPAGELAVQRPAEREAVQDRELGRGVPVAGVMVSGVSGGGFQAGTELGVADLVRPLPVEEAAGTARLPGSARWPASLSRSAWPRARRSATTPATRPSHPAAAPGACRTARWPETLRRVPPGRVPAAVAGAAVAPDRLDHRHRSLTGEVHRRGVAVAVAAVHDPEQRVLRG